MGMVPETWTISALATSFKMDRRTVAARLAGIKPAQTNGKSKRYNLDDAAKALLGKIPTAEGIISYDEARARKIAAEAEMAEIELQKERGEVLPLDVINAVNDEIYGNFRSRMLAIPAKAAPDIFAAADAKEAKAILRRHINAALQELSDMMVETYESDNSEYTGSEDGDEQNS